MEFTLAARPQLLLRLTPVHLGRTERAATPLPELVCDPGDFVMIEGLHGFVLRAPASVVHPAIPSASCSLFTRSPISCACFKLPEPAMAML